MVAEKTCRTCGDSKPLDEFHNTISSPDGKYGRCKFCVREANRAWREANKDKVAASKKNYGLHNAEKIRAKSKFYYERDKEKRAEYRRKYLLVSRYNITIEQYDKLYETCGGKCEICRRPLSSARNSKHTACIDHDHESGEVRGILCRKCNQALGTFGDSVEGLKVAIAYLERAKGARSITYDDQDGRQIRDGSSPVE